MICNPFSFLQFVSFCLFFFCYSMIRNFSTNAYKFIDLDTYPYHRRQQREPKRAVLPPPPWVFTHNTANVCTSTRFAKHPNSHQSSLFFIALLDVKRQRQLKPSADLGIIKFFFSHRMTRNFKKGGIFPEINVSPMKDIHYAGHLMQDPLKMEPWMLVILLIRHCKEGDSHNWYYCSVLCTGLLLEIFLPIPLNGITF